MEQALGYNLCLAQTTRLHMHVKCLCSPINLYAVQTSRYVLTSINNNDFAVATRHNFLQGVLNLIVCPERN
jgi:hypothetical protein